MQEETSSYDDLGLEEPLPLWAVGRTRDYTAVGAQLRTRDGLSTGNAVVMGTVTKPDGTYTEILTDAGNRIRCTEEELACMFHEPEYLMNPHDAPGIINELRRDLTPVDLMRNLMIAQIVQRAGAANTGVQAIDFTFADANVSWVARKDGRVLAVGEYNQVLNLEDLVDGPFSTNSETGLDNLTTVDLAYFMDHGTEVCSDEALLAWAEEAADPRPSVRRMKL